MKTKLILTTTKLIYIFFVLSFVILFKTVPTLGAKIQFSELLFIPLFCLSFFVLVKGWRLYSLLPIDIFVIIFSIIFTLICLINDFSKTYLEIFGVFYFLAIYFVFNLFYKDINLDYFKQYLYFTILTLSLTGILGIVLTQLGIDTFLAWSKNSPYPYFQGFGRARGLSGHPNNLMTIISIGWILKLSDLLFSKYKLKAFDFLFFMISGIAAFLTFSKMGILLIIGLSILIIQKNNSTFVKYCIKLFTALLILFYLIVTHYGIYNSNSPKYDILLKSGLVSDFEVYKINEKFSIFENNYTLTKKAALNLGLENQPFGIGHGQFIEFYQNFKDKGYFTKYMNAFEPHSIYTGFWVENGVVGLLSLLILFYFIWKYFRKNKPEIHEVNYSTFIACTTVFAIYLIDGFVTDVFFLRYYFIIFVLATVIIRKKILKQLKTPM